MRKSTAVETRQAMLLIPFWKRGGGAISRTFEFADFPSAIRFVNQVARKAEAANHHPDIDIRWNKVRLRLTTHDAGGLTGADFALAEVCDKLGVVASG